MGDSLCDRIAAGRTDLVAEWLRRGGNPGAGDEQGRRLAASVAYFGDVTALAALVAAGARLAELGPNLDLQGAAFHGHWRLVEYLLDAGADAAWADPETGETALHAALSRPGLAATLPLVQVLLRAGADPNRPTRPGVPTGCFMRDVRTRGETPLHRAAAFADLAVLDALLAAGADLRARDAHGDSPLTWASWHLRPDPILRRLCFPPHQIHPERRTMAEALQGGPLVP